MNFYWNLYILCFIFKNVFSSTDYLEDPPVAQNLKTYPPGPPVFIEQPKSVIAETKEGITLYCRAKGTPKPKIRWLKDGSPLDLANVRGVVTLPVGDLVFLQVRDKNQESSTTGIYQCIASNSYGSVASQNVSVEVANIGDDFRKQPSDAIAITKSSVTIDCQGPRGIPEPVISWKKNSQDLVLDDRMKIKPGGNLRITHLKKSDSGKYECVANNTAGTRISTAAELRVQDPPRFIVRPTSANAFVGESLTLKCKVDGDPSPRIQWTKRGGILPKRFIITREGNLRMVDLTLKDEGEYFCTAQNSVAKQSSSAILSIKMKPKIISSSSAVTAQVGKRAVLECRVEGKPVPTQFWRNPDGIEIFFENPIDHGRIAADVNGDLIINNLRFDDQGSYVCQAFSDIGSATANVELNVRAKVPNVNPPIVSLSPFNITAKLGSDVILQCLAPDAFIRWYKNNKLVQTGSDRFQKLSSGSLQITNLQNTDEGCYTCKATNENGLDEWDAWIHVSGESNQLPDHPTLKLPTAPSQPVNVNVTSNCVTIKWTSESVVGFYIVEYYRVGSGLSTWSRVSPVLQKVFKLCNLRPTSDYVFAVRAVNKNGTGPVSSKSDFIRTSEPIFNTSPPTLHVLNSIQTELVQATVLPYSGIGAHRSVEIKWQSTADCNSVDSFMVEERKVSNLKAYSATQQSTCSSRTFQLTDIEENSSYEIRVRPIKDMLVGPSSSIKFLSLKKGLFSPSPPIITSTTLTENQEQVKVQWQAPRDLPSSYLIGYKIRYRSNASGHLNEFSVNASITETVLDDLISGSTYELTVTYTTPIGDGVKSDAVDVSINPRITNVFTQPAVIGAIAGGIVLLLIVIFTVICCCRRSRRNTRFQGKRKQNSNVDDFIMVKMKPDTSMPIHGNGERHHLTYNATPNEYNIPGNECFRNAANENQLLPPAFSYTPNQALMTQMPRTTMPDTQPTTFEQLQQHERYLQQRNGQSIYGEPQHSDVGHSPPNTTHSRPLCSMSDLPPPPPTPPMSLPSPQISQRSRTSSGRRSTGDRSSRSGNRTRRSIRSKRPGVAIQHLPEQMDVEYEAYQQTALLGSSENNNLLTYTPTPPVRVDSNDSSLLRNHSQRKYSDRCPISSLEYYNVHPDAEVESEVDRFKRSQGVRSNLGYNMRNSGNVSNVSMVNRFGSDSDLHESFYDHQSALSSLSDAESFHMESVSQVGQNRDEVENNIDTNHQSNMRLNNNILLEKRYPHTYNHYPVEGGMSSQPQLLDHVIKTNRVLQNEKTFDNQHYHSKHATCSLERANSSNSFASSSHQNTGDSGMSAGIGCSTAQSSSLNSHASAEIANRPAVGVGKHPSISTGLVPLNNPTYSSSNSPLCSNIRKTTSPSDISGVSNHGLNSNSSSSDLPVGQSLHMSSQASRIPTSLQRNKPCFQDSKWSSRSISKQTPLSPIQSPDIELSYNEKEKNVIGGLFEQTPDMNLNELNSKPLLHRPHNLYDLPEVSTSDFCEDYSDQS